jgi:hypothetical protein
VPGLIENYKWSRPVFSTTSDFAYFKTAKNYLTFGFFQFHKIKTRAEILEGSGKDMRHIKFKALGEIKEDLLRTWIRELVG